VLTLTGTDTLAHYQAVLASVSYGSANANPTNNGADAARTVSWRVNDGTVNSATITSTIRLQAAAAAPAVTFLAVARQSVPAASPPLAAAADPAVPQIALQQTARSFTVSQGNTHAWLDDMLNPADLKASKANAWSIVIKRPTLH
jgi:hypothetical protein